MNVLIICGESSSNQYGADLSRALTKAGHHVYSYGSQDLAKVSTQLYFIDPLSHTVTYGNWLRRYILFRKLAKLSKTAHQSHGFDRVVIIDFPSYNFKFANIFSNLNIPIVTFITPNFWIWAQQRLAKKIIQYSHNIITIFKKEYDYYHALAPQKTVYFGHPLTLDHPQNPPPNTPIHPPYHIGLFPGSRIYEIQQNLPTMCRILAKLNNSAIQPTLYCSNQKLIATIQPILSKYGLDSMAILQKPTTPIHVAITAPGSNTLLLAFKQIPMVIVGKIPWFSYIAATYILRLKIPFIGLPNIILGKPVCPEKIQNQTSTQDTANAISNLLSSQSACSQMTQQFHALHANMMAAPNYYDQVCDVVVSV
jgi:lipid-A-disaccharide synthase